VSALCGMCIESVTQAQGKGGYAIIRMKGLSLFNFPEIKRHEPCLLTMVMVIAQPYACDLGK